MRGLSDASGALTDRYTYDAYGLPTSTGTTVNPYRYRGEQYDADLNASYLRARYYQPGTGRFMTTDFFEGGPNLPISQHKYLYGNANPVNIIDPTGHFSLTEALVVAAEVNLLSMFALSEVEKSGLASPYSWLAKNVLPEAYIIGCNLSGTIPPSAGWYLQSIFGETPFPLELEDLSTNGLLGVGVEVIFSVGSGETALFWTKTLGHALPSLLSGGVELYDGFVFNLWNAEDYKGSFESLSLGLNTKNISGGVSLFWDAGRQFAGPWGGAKTFLSKSWDSSSRMNVKLPLNFTKADIAYKMLGKPFHSPRAEMIENISAIILTTKLVQTIDKRKLTGEPFAFWLFETTVWGHVGLAHHYWNKKEPQYNLETRREHDRPDEYHSGPSIWNLPL